MKDKIVKIIKDSIAVKLSIVSDIDSIGDIELISKKMISIFKDDNKLLLCGNGGSAADAQHIAAELSGRFYKDRGPLFAEALHVNTSYLTAVSNDYGYDHVYSRMVEAMGRHGDALLAISTSGNSKNIVNAVKSANLIGMFTIGFTGKSKSDLDHMCDIIIKVPSDNPARVQESHILLGHILCQILEEALFHD